MKESVNYAWPVTAVHKVVYNRFQKAVNDIKNKYNFKKIVVFGAGIRGTLFSVMLEKEGISDFIFTDNNKEKWDGYINDYPILSLEDALSDIKNTMVFITVENGNAIKKQLDELGYSENENYFFMDTNLYDEYMKEYKKNDGIDTLIIGDCGLTHISMLDENKKNLGELITDKIDDSKSKVLAMHGMGMRAFYNIICSQLIMGVKPKNVIILVNFDTFTGKHHFLPRSQHTELFRRIVNYSQINTWESNEYLKLTEERFNSFHTELSSAKNIKHNNIDALSALYMKMNYMYRLKGDNEGIIYLLKILELFNENKIVPTLFVPPVNYMRGEQYYGEKFHDAYASNFNKLSELVKSRGFDLLDLSFLLEDNEFADVSTVDECANYQGRLKIRDMILDYYNKKSDEE